MEKNIQIIKVSTSILDYYKMVMNFDNEGDQYRKVMEKEFIDELTKALNCSVGKKEIKWI